VAGLIAGPGLEAAHAQLNVTPNFPGVQPPVPSPFIGPPPSINGPLSQPSFRASQPPRLNSFSDRVTSCLHSFPLAGGQGNNPSERDAYVRSCAN
jgi:hypothetical protein